MHSPRHPALLLRFLFVGAIGFYGLSTRAEAPSPESALRVEDSVVKVFSTIRQPDTSKPWAKQSPQEATGTGVIIEGHRILNIDGVPLDHITRSPFIAGGLETLTPLSLSRLLIEARNNPDRAGTQ